ncbi:unnamed protein product [Mytilus coruscus]|uniref:WSC domain-containing protein n=1 Tax=Mytilus coruscus TaxID=42192 RepID=A0A6J8D206_MYTCO|nr:unnamed protein product [Mytilus coruscus]
MDKVMFCSFFVHWWINGCLGEIYFSDTDGIGTYDRAVEYCSRLKGRLLPYGKEIVEAAKDNGMSGSAWVGKPWFKNMGCFNFDVNSSIFIELETTNVSSYICASYCKDDQYKYFGMTMTQCYCLQNHDEATNYQAYGQCNETCSGNQAETCGSNNNWILYRKGASFSDVTTISTSIFENESWNGLEIGVGVGVTIIFVIGIVVCVYCKLRHKRSVDVKQKNSENPRTGDVTVFPAYEIPWSEKEALNPPWSEDNSVDHNIYDHASHKVHRENNDFMVYDMADKTNNEYSITTFRKQQVDPECQQIQSNEYQLDDYDTCASVEIEIK